MLRAVVSIFLTCMMLVTGIHAASARGAAPAVDQVVICAGHGTQVLYLDADGAPTKAPHLCPDCVLHFAAPIPDLVQALRPAVVSEALCATTVTVGQIVPDRPVLMPVRGPPSKLF